MTQIILLVVVTILIVTGTVALTVISRKIDAIHGLVNSRLSEMIVHVVATGRAEALLAALQSRLEGVEQGKREALEQITKDAK